MCIRDSYDYDSKEKSQEQTYSEYQGNKSKRANKFSYALDSYQILGCKKGDSKKILKKKYRKLVMKYHPDRLIAKGVPKEMIKESEKKFLRIQKAFEEVMKDYE